MFWTLWWTQNFLLLFFFTFFTTEFFCVVLGYPETPSVDQVDLELKDWRSNAFISWVLRLTLFLALFCFGFVYNQKVKPQFESLFSDKSGVEQKITYLVSIFAILKELNLSLQGLNTSCLYLSKKICSLQLKLQLWVGGDENATYRLERWLSG